MSWCLLHQGNMVHVIGSVPVFLVALSVLSVECVLVCQAVACLYLQEVVFSSVGTGLSVGQVALVLNVYVCMPGCVCASVLVVMSGLVCVSAHVPDGRVVLEAGS